MQGTGRKHLLLVDPEGVVRSTSAIPYSSDKPRLTDNNPTFSRTRDRTFESVTHLIDYHRNNKLPIISAESALRLDTPVANMRR